MPTADFSRSPQPADPPRIKLAHGSGGRLMHDLINTVFAAAFGSNGSETEHDGAIVKSLGGNAVFTTDSFVVDPLFFPGGDIGSLAVIGTVNDLAMCGARPLYLSAAFIIEEGLPLADLTRIAQSMAAAASGAHVRIVTGDTKVVDRGHGHDLFITTAGIGICEHDLHIHPRNIKPGDTVIVSGDIGRHGIAVLSQREGFSISSDIESDCAELAGAVSSLIAADLDIHCLRDLTRGGLATTLVELAESSRMHIVIDEKAVPVREDVHGVCEILGLDPFYAACEGRFVIVAPESDATQVLRLLPEACLIGRVTGRGQGTVTLKSLIGSERCLDMLSGEQFPRIC